MVVLGFNILSCSGDSPVTGKESQDESSLSDRAVSKDSPCLTNSAALFPTSKPPHDIDRFSLSLFSVLT